MNDAIVKKAALNASRILAWITACSTDGCEDARRLHVPPSSQRCGPLPDSRGRKIAQSLQPRYQRPRQSSAKTELRRQLAQLQRPRRTLHTDLHDAHHRSHEQPVAKQQPSEHDGAKPRCPEGKKHKINRDQPETDDRKHRGQPGPVDELSGYERADSNSDRERDQQQAGCRRRSPRTTSR